jgi:RsiW-degrading membrane proteinase PrsW (M82 family)
VTIVLGILAAYGIGAALAFPPALLLFAAAARARVFDAPWWVVVVLALWTAVAWPWALLSLLP